MALYPKEIDSTQGWWLLYMADRLLQVCLFASVLSLPYLMVVYDVMAGTLMEWYPIEQLQALPLVGPVICSGWFL